MYPVLWELLRRLRSPAQRVHPWKLQIRSKGRVYAAIMRIQPH